MATVITGDERTALIAFVREGLTDFEAQMKDPRLIREFGTQLNDRHRDFVTVLETLETNPVVHRDLFDRDQTRDLQFLVQAGCDQPDEMRTRVTRAVSDSAIEQVGTRLVKLTEDLDAERRKTDFPVDPTTTPTGPAPTGGEPTVS
ncbi:MAG: hypothetical protein ACTIDO_16980 [Brevibacterium aurantiacum]|uniref:hypothetical protein n=1 Tax=Brevibacterium aurantiacum TaxID=273384 RepID=UPI003F936236